jgi:hypothetical protein
VQTGGEIGCIFPMILWRAARERVAIECKKNGNRLDTLRDRARQRRVLVFVERSAPAPASMRSAIT